MASNIFAVQLYTESKDTYFTGVSGARTCGNLFKLGWAGEVLRQRPRGARVRQGKRDPPTRPCAHSVKHTNTALNNYSDTLLVKLPTFPLPPLPGVMHDTTVMHTTLLILFTVGSSDSRRILTGTKVSIPWHNLSQHWSSTVCKSTGMWLKCVNTSKHCTTCELSRLPGSGL